MCCTGQLLVGPALIPAEALLQVSLTPPWLLTDKTHGALCLPPMCNHARLGGGCVTALGAMSIEDSERRELHPVINTGRP